MKVAIVHDFLAQPGGAERVVEAMHSIWPDAPIYTSIFDPEGTFPSFRTMDVRTSFLQRNRLTRSVRFHKYALTLYPIAFEQFDLSGYDVVLSSSSSFAKGVITGPETCHICYCHTPTRFAWRYHEYMARGNFGRLTRLALPLIMHRLRQWDFDCARQRVDYFVANSFNIARRIKKYYGRESEVIYPPVDMDRFQIASHPAADYFLVVSRLNGYKNVDIAVEACRRLGVPLKVVGAGEELARLKAIAGPDTEFLGRRDDEEITRLYANCRALLFPGDEDFGITPLEAMASGRPVLAYGVGGALETVVDGVTGFLFPEPTAESLMDAMARLEKSVLEPERCRAHARRFESAVFKARLKSAVETRWRQHQAEYAQLTPAAMSPLAPEAFVESAPFGERSFPPTPEAPEMNGHNGPGYSGAFKSPGKTPLLPSESVPTAPAVFSKRRPEPS